MAPMSPPPPSSQAGGSEASGGGEAVVVTGKGEGKGGGEGGGDGGDSATCDVRETRSKAAVEPATPVFRKPMASVLPTSGSPTANVLLTLNLVQIEGHPLIQWTCVGCPSRRRIDLRPPRSRSPAGNRTPCTCRHSPPAKSVSARGPVGRRRRRGVSTPRNG
eukprot:scaffold18952_cov72-Phaeocystis_antarctica.AAC.5